jgi:tetratricopeptide (TPR) repeat protein
MTTISSIELAHCLWLFRLEAFRECVEFIDERLSSPLLGEESSTLCTASAALLKAKSLVALGEPGAAAQACQPIYTRSPYNLSSCLMAGNLLLGELECFEEAIKCFDTVTEKIEQTASNAEDIAKAWHNKALAHLRLSQVECATTALERCTSVAPRDSRTAQNARHVLDVLNGRVRPERHGAGIQFEIM